jgi:TM2 domain-containing membrane protein YozV
MRTDQEKYCFSCGTVISSRAAVCSNCGVQQPDIIRNKDFNYNWLAAFLLCFLLGVFGAHRFYLGRVGSGVLMLVTFGGLGIWYLVDLILLIVGQLRDQNGQFVRPYIDSNF